MKTIYHIYKGKFINSKEIFGEFSEYNTSIFINFVKRANEIVIICDQHCINTLTEKLNEKYGLTISKDEYPYFIREVNGDLCSYYLELSYFDKHKLFDRLKHIKTTYIINGNQLDKEYINIKNIQDYMACKPYIEHMFDKNYKLISKHYTAIIPKDTICFFKELIYD